MIEGLNISIPQRMILIRITVTLSLIISVFLSLNLWGGERLFPYNPVFEEGWIQPPFDFSLIGLTILFWLGSLFLRNQRVFIFLACLMSFFLILFDLNRLQPWFYMYSALMVVFIFYDGRVDDSNKFTSFFIIVQLIVASFYFFNGLSLLNVFFVDGSFAEIINPIKNSVSERQFLFLKKMGNFVPYFLLFIGAGLIISPLRYLAITLALILHFLLLIFLFPSSSQLNYALWFSNLPFMVLLLFLFSGKTKQRYFSPLNLFQRPIFYPVVVLFLIMPFFNLTNRWPDYLSSNFKSGNNQKAFISFGENVYTKLPLYPKHFCIQKDSYYIFNYQAWCAHELNSDYFPSSSTFNSIYGYLARISKGDVKEVKLEIKPKEKGLF